jgi:hypothetical protein
MFNSDLIKEVQELVFDRFTDFQKWLQENHPKAESFICAPIELFYRYWQIVDRFQSGNIEYRKKNK